MPDDPTPPVIPEEDPTEELPHDERYMDAAAEAGEER